MLLIALILFLFGLVAGSFASALSWRLYNQEDWVKERSQCPVCGHQLAAKDLIPLLSWLSLAGRCRYCRQPIAKLYPMVELAGGVVFASSYLFWQGSLGAGQKVLLFGWLLCAVLFLALSLYDFRWRLLPNHLVYPALVIAIVSRLVYIIHFSTTPGHDAWLWFWSVAVASGLFWLIYQASAGRLIGFGDVRLGLVTGTILGTPSLSILMIFLASTLGSLSALPAVLRRQKTLKSQISYGPFLMTATWLCLLFGQPVIDWYKRLLGQG